MNWSRHLMLVLGAGLIGLECWGVWEYMQFKGAPMYLACLGILVAISAPSLGLIRGPMQWVALLVARIAMVAVLTTAMARMASVADVSLQSCQSDAAKRARRSGRTRLRANARRGARGRSPRVQQRSNQEMHRGTDGAEHRPG